MYKYIQIGSFLLIVVHTYFMGRNYILDTKLEQLVTRCGVPQK